MIKMVRGGEGDKDDGRRKGGSCRSLPSVCDALSLIPIVGIKDALAKTDS